MCEKKFIRRSIVSMIVNPSLVIKRYFETYLFSTGQSFTILTLIANQRKNNFCVQSENYWSPLLCVGSTNQS